MTDSSATNVLLLHAAATWALVGLIWTIQLVQYPGFARVAPTTFPAFHQHHASSITWIVGPLMLAELATALWLLFGQRPPGLSAAFLGFGLGLVLLNFAWTAFVAMPLHGTLGAVAADSGEGLRAMRRLVATNWMRTAAWTARGIWALFALRASMGTS